MQTRERPPIDHSLNLSEPPDDRDLGRGIEIGPNGQLWQRSEPTEHDLDDGSMPFPHARRVDRLAPDYD